MLRWGIVATLIWHYTVDASLVGLLLVRSNSLYFRISGVVVAAAALAPLAFACISYLTRGGFEANEELLNRAARPLDLSNAGEPVGETTETSSRRYEALTPAIRGFLAICLVAGGVLVWRLKPETIGDYLKLSTDSRSARSTADQLMRRRGVDPGSFYHATVFADIADPITNEFLRQRLGTARVNEIYAQHVPAALWRVRYFRDSQPEEFAVILRPDGTLHSLRHTLAEEAPGSSLTKEEAVARSQKFLNDEKKIDLKDWELVDSASDKKPHRTDHTLSWQQKTPLDPGASGASGDHAYARIELQVLGEEITNYRTYIKIPDAWRRAHGERSLVRALLSFGVPMLFFVGLGLTGLILFLKNLKSETAGSIPWKRIILWSLWGFAGYVLILTFGDRVPNFLNSYDTAVPMKMFFGFLAIGTLIGGPLYLGGIALSFGAAWYFAVKAFGKERLPGWLRMPSAYYRDALFIGLGGTAGLLGLERLLAAGSTHWSTAHRYLDVVFGQNFDAVFPAVSVLGGTLLRGLLFTGLVTLIASFIAAHVRQPSVRLLLFLLGALSLVGGGWGTPADFAKQLLARLILLGVLVFGVRFVMRFNLLGCFLVVAGTSLVTEAAEMLAQPDAFYRSNGYAVLLMLALLFAWPLAAWRMNSAIGTPPGAGSGASA